MCGIAGVLINDSERALASVRAMNDRQRHRGPDHAVAELVGPWALGNTRLAIRDLSTGGLQPFRSENGRYVAVFNGEIYNADALRKVHRLGVSSRCDGAVIPALFEKFGNGAFSRLEGMFSIAVMDTRSGTLTLARDPFGIKPLFLRHLPHGGLAFASESRALGVLEPGLVIDRSSIAAFLWMGAVPFDRSPYRGIHPVLPNQIVTIRLGVTRRPELRYEVIHDGPHPLYDAEDTQALANAFRKSVASHLVSDVEVALLLSSGVDSSAIAVAAGQLGHKLHTFTVAIPGVADESASAAEAARTWGHEHRTVQATLTADLVTSFFASMSSPTVDGLNTFLVCHAIADAGYRVALSGLGGDEALLGYRHMQLSRLLPLLSVSDRLPFIRRITEVVLQRTSNGGKVNSLFQSDGPRSCRELARLAHQLLHPEMAKFLVGSVPQENEEMGAASHELDVREAEVEAYLQGMLLPDADAFSMASSVELRVPFLSRRVFAAAVRTRALHPKRVLSDGLDDPLLKRIARGPKQGFELPVRRWMRDGPLRAACEEVNSRESPLWQYIDPDRVASMPEHVKTHWTTRWALAVLNGWLSCTAESGPIPPKASSRIVLPEIAMAVGALPSRVLALLPSTGLGGGIEEYVGSMLDELSQYGVEVERVVLRRNEGRGFLNRTRFLVESYVRARLWPPTIVLNFHPNFAVVAGLISRHEIPVLTFLYGIDIWSLSWFRRRMLRAIPMRFATISDFSAKAMRTAGLPQPCIVPPIVSRRRYDRLRAVSRVRSMEDLKRPMLLSVFRLSDVRAKGGFALIEAIELLRQRGADIHLTIAGHGPVPHALAEAAATRPWLQIMSSVEWEDLVALYSKATVFCLATRMELSARAPSGEGFGIVLLEAQLTGLPVIAPVQGGSKDAFIEGITGTRPHDESAESLACAIDRMLSNPQRLTGMSATAAIWSSELFHPDRSFAQTAAAIMQEMPV